MADIVDPFEAQLEHVRRRIEQTFAITAEELISCGSDQFGADMVADGYGELVVFAEEATVTHTRLERLVSPGPPGDPGEAKRITEVSKELTSLIQRRNYRLNVVHIYLDTVQPTCGPAEAPPVPQPPAERAAPRRTR